MKAKRFINWVLVALFVVSLLQVLFDPFSFLINTSGNIQARIRLPIARRKWESQNIHHYKFDIRGYVPLLCIFDGNVEVREGVVVGTGPRSDGGENLLAVLPTLSSRWDDQYFLCDARNYTIPLLFSELERSLNGSGQPVTRISFDSQYGFISRYGFGLSGGQGLLSPRISDCCGGFTVENFEILNDGE